jgi:hypothetical protein
LWSEKLPFAGYSIVKELTHEAFSYQLTAASLVERRFAASFTQSSASSFPPAGSWELETGS